MISRQLEMTWVLYPRYLQTLVPFLNQFHSITMDWKDKHGLTREAQDWGYWWDSKMRSILLLFFLTISTLSFGQEAFLIEDEKNRKIPINKILYYEGDWSPLRGQTIKKFDYIYDVDDSAWTNRLNSHQSYIRGFWIKYRIKNLTDYYNFGLDHHNHLQKLVYTKNEK